MNEQDNVRVVVRCRPMNGKEKETGCKLVVKVSHLYMSVEIRDCYFEVCNHIILS